MQYNEIQYNTQYNTTQHKNKEVVKDEDEDVKHILTQNTSTQLASAISYY